MDFSKLLLYIPGVIIFLVGSGLVRDWLRMRRSDLTSLADVVSCTHVVKKDKKDREIYDYYNVVVEYTDPKTKHTKRQAIKSPTEFAQSQQVRIIVEKNSETPELIENKTEFPIHPWAMMIGGALLILLALEQNRGDEVGAMVCFTLVLAGAGLNLILNYLALRRRGLVELDAEIVSVFTRQISKGSKILKGDKYTYYPVVRYELDGHENMRRCNVNSGSEKSFKTGDHIKLYYDPQDHTVQEKHAQAGLLVLGIALLAVGILAGASILSVLL